MSLGERLQNLTPEWIKRCTSYCSTLRVKSKLLLSVYIIILVFFLFDLGIFSFIVWIWFNMPLQEPGLMRPHCLNDAFQGVSYTINNSTLKIVKIYVLSEEKNFDQSLEFCQSRNATLWNVDSEDEWKAVTKFILYFSPVDIWLNGKVEGKNCPSGNECLKNQSYFGQGLPVRWSPSQKVGTYSRLYRGETSEKKCLVVEPTLDMLWTTSYCELEKHTPVCIKRDCFTGL